MAKIIAHVEGQLSGTYVLSRVPCVGEYIGYDERVLRVDAVVHQSFVDGEMYDAAIRATESEDWSEFSVVDDIFQPRRF